MAFDARSAANMLMESAHLPSLLAEARQKNAGASAAPAAVASALADAQALQASIDQSLVNRVVQRAEKVATVRRILHLCSRLDPVC